MDAFDNGSIRGKLYATDWLSKLSYSGGTDVVQVQFKNTRNGFYANPSGLKLSIGDIVAVEANPGHDIGRVMMTGPLVRMQMKKAGITGDADLKKIFRLARPSDMEKFEEARAREQETMIRSRQIAAELELDMKIGDVEYQGDGGKAIFYYIADERVDFRKLIRILADTFKVRIEMKQIGARQEAGRIGGIGPCGRPLCCSSWMGKFVSVGTGAARLQDLSMNPQKLAGQCAKLKCCLNFETDVYAEAVRQLPAKDITLETKDATYFYFKPDILARTVTYSTDKHIPANLVTIDAARAFEIIALNKQGIKVDSLLPENTEETPKEYIDLTDQDSLTRFDKSKKKKKKGAVKDKKQDQNRNENRDLKRDRNNNSRLKNSQSGNTGMSNPQQNNNDSKSSHASNDNRKHNRRPEQGHRRNHSRDHHRRHGNSNQSPNPEQ